MADVAPRPRRASVVSKISDGGLDMEDDDEFTKSIPSEVSDEQAMTMVKKVYEHKWGDMPLAEKNLNPAVDLGLIASCFSVLSFSTDEVIMKQGEHASFFGLILQGELKIVIPGLDIRLSPGSLIGEMSYFEGGKRSVDVITNGNCMLAVITFEDMVTLSNYEPDFCRNMIKLLGAASIKKLRKMMAKGPAKEEEMVVEEENCAPEQMLVKKMKKGQDEKKEGGRKDRKQKLAMSQQQVEFTIKRLKMQNKNQDKKIKSFEAEQQVTEATIAAKKQEIMRLKEWLDKEMLEKETSKREETKMRADFQPLKQHNYQLKSKNTKLQLRVDELEKNQNSSREQLEEELSEFKHQVQTMDHQLASQKKNHTDFKVRHQAVFDELTKQHNILRTEYHKECANAAKLQSEMNVAGQIKHVAEQKMARAKREAVDFFQKLSAERKKVRSFRKLSNITLFGYCLRNAVKTRKLLARNYEDIAELVILGLEEKLKSQAFASSSEPTMKSELRRQKLCRTRMRKTKLITQSGVCQAMACIEEELVMLNDTLRSLMSQMQDNRRISHRLSNRVSELTFTVATTREERDKAVKQMRLVSKESKQREERLKQVEFERSQLLEHKDQSDHMWDEMQRQKGVIANRCISLERMSGHYLAKSSDDGFEPLAQQLAHWGDSGKPPKSPSKLLMPPSISSFASSSSFENSPTYRHGISQSKGRRMSTPPPSSPALSPAPSSASRSTHSHNKPQFSTYAEDVEFSPRRGALPKLLPLADHRQHRVKRAYGSPTNHAGLSGKGRGKRKNSKGKKSSPKKKNVPKAQDRWTAAGGLRFARLGQRGGEEQVAAADTEQLVLEETKVELEKEPEAESENAVEAQRGGATEAPRNLSGPEKAAASPDESGADASVPRVLLDPPAMPPIKEETELRSSEQQSRESSRDGSHSQN